MNPLTDTERADLARLLDNHVLIKALDAIGDLVEADLENGQAAPELAIQMAREKGARSARNLLHRLASPSSIPESRQSPRLARSIHSTQQP